MSYVYRNLSTGQVIERADRSARLDYLSDRWELLSSADEARNEPLRSDGILSRPGMATAKQTNGSTTRTLVEAAPVERPADRAAKAEWVAYAVDRGAKEDEAKGLSRDELVDRYGG